MIKYLVYISREDTNILSFVDNRHPSVKNFTFMAIFARGFAKG